MPGSIEAYYQEAGRAGRDGNPACCGLLFNIGDRRIHRYFIAGRQRSARTRRVRAALAPDRLGHELRLQDARRERDEEKLERMIVYAQTALCRWGAILAYFGESGTPGSFACGHCDACENPKTMLTAVQPTDNRRPSESPLPPPVVRQFEVGEVLDVPPYGAGEIAGFADDNIEIRFPDGEVRKFKAGFLR
jgi:ATP-dependent DNA helicase RecQ